MDKQQLASTIWNTAEDLRGNIESYTYKDYILGLLFYKFLTDQEYNVLSKDLSMSDEEIYQIDEQETDIVEYCQDNLGYFIEPKNFYRKWINDIDDFTEDDLITSLGAYERNIPKNTKHVFGEIFDTITRNLTSLAPSTNERTKSLRNLLLTLKDVPTINTEYDVLGYVYEYLISKFSAGAGKKSGEFFTPAEVSTAIARIVAHNLKDKETITVLDPTAGSGSLLLAVGNTFEKTKNRKSKVKYYYQELVKGTYNMCRQNLVMRGVMPSNMVGRNGDTLDLDYPYFSDDNPDETYKPVFVDAVVANPPYSQKYDPNEIKESPRFDEYGLPPASKADYAFLLHNLYHLKTDGIQVIVLPHGVLFRNDEAEIRTKLIKKYQIEAVIGLPANVFFGTGIPTTLLILKKHRDESDIFFIDASKGFIKDGNKNKLRESDVQKIVDTYINREEIEKYSRTVDYDEIEENEFNLNISRYINSEPDPEKHDTYGVIHGAIPKDELQEKFETIWNKFPTLYTELFEGINDGYVVLKVENIIDTINENKEVKEAKENYNSTIDSFTEDMKSYLFDHLLDLDLSNIQFEIKEKLFHALDEFQLIDNYGAYQEFYNHWKDTELDIEEIHENGITVANELVKVTKTKKIRGRDEEVFDHWEGRILPFDLVQRKYLLETKERLESLLSRNDEIKGELDNLVSMLDEEDGNKVLNDNKDAFSAADLKNELNSLFEDIDTPEIQGIKEYFALLDARANKQEKLDFMENHPEVDWNKIEKNKDGTVGKANLNIYLKEMQLTYEFEEDSLGYILSNAQALRDEESANRKEIKEIETELQDRTGEIIKNLTEKEIYELLEEKWINPVNDSIKLLMDTLFNSFENELNATIEKYGNSLSSIEEKEKEINSMLKTQLLELTGSESDLEGINQFIKMLEV